MSDKTIMEEAIELSRENLDSFRAIPYGLNTNSPWCSSVDGTCEHLLIPTSNSMQPDKCLKFATLIDRNSRQRPVRCEQCVSKYS